MKAKDGVIDHLNNLLTIELTAINQYFVQAEMCKNWGFNRLYGRFRAISMEEMEDAQHLIQHILFLEGVPNLQRLNQVMVGETVQEDLELDLQAELNAVSALTDAISHCATRLDGRQYRGVQAYPLRVLSPYRAILGHGDRDSDSSKDNRSSVLIPRVMLTLLSPSITT